MISRRNLLKGLGALMVTAPLACTYENDICIDGWNNGNIQPLLPFDFDQEVIMADYPVVVKFWAPWCGACSIVAPKYQELAESDCRLKFTEYNVDYEIPGFPVAKRYGFSAIPTFMVFKDHRPFSICDWKDLENTIEDLFSDPPSKA